MTINNEEHVVKTDFEEYTSTKEFDDRQSIKYKDLSPYFVHIKGSMALDEGNDMMHLAQSVTKLGAEYGR